MRKLLPGIIILFFIPNLFAQVSSYEYLDINNIKARINANSMLFWDGDDRDFEAPIGSGKCPLFTSGLWIGATDQNNQLHLAASRYSQGPNNGAPNSSFDYYNGPISQVYDEAYDQRWNKVWKINNEEITFHIRNFNLEGYIPIDAISTWPAHGNIANGEMMNIAPFYDHDSDGEYNPMEGDYPLIRGDQAIFYVLNDERDFHYESEGKALSVQIHVMAYAFDRPRDSSLSNSIFFHYDLYNLANNDWTNTYLGLFSDIDIGYADDDYVGCDVKGSSFYGYNGLETDGNGQPYSYGENPPAMSTTFIAGPFLDPDEIDGDPVDQLNYSYNGIGFNDGIIDNERFGMTRFISFNNSGSVGHMTDPEHAPEYYKFMKAIWKDNSKMIYGGNGHPACGGGVGPECNFMFPGDSDPENWGTLGIEPNGGYNQNGLYWTEEQVDNPVSDRRAVGATGPFTFRVNEKQELDISYMFAQSFNSKDNMGSVTLLRERIAEVRDRVANGEIINLHATTLGEQEEESKLDFHLFPNPANEKFRVVIPEEMKNMTVTYTIMSSDGSYLKSGTLCGDQTISTDGLHQGLYFIKILTKKQKAVKKLIVL